MTSPLRIGMIGLDTSHVTAFTNLLNDPANANHVPGGKVVVAFPGGIKDVPLSGGRLEKFTDELKNTHGVTIVDSPEAVAEASDLVFIESVHGSVHLEEFKRTVKYKRPTFIDKPFTHDLREAREILKLADEAGIPVMSCSALRYADAFVEARAKIQEPLVAIDVWGPCSEQPTVPGLFWYGVHTVEMLVAAMGPGASAVQSSYAEHQEVMVVEYADGRRCTVRGMRESKHAFGGVLHSAAGAVAFDVSTSRRPYYAGLLQAIMADLPQGRSSVPAAEMLEAVAVLEAGTRSRKSGERVIIAAS